MSYICATRPLQGEGNTGTPARRRLTFFKLRDISRRVIRNKQTEDFVLNNTMKLRSGATIRHLTREQAEAKNYLPRETLVQMHLIPGGDPVAFFCPDPEAETLTDVVFFFHPEHVQEAPPELW